MAQASYTISGESAATGEGIQVWRTALSAAEWQADYTAADAYITGTDEDGDEIEPTTVEPVATVAAVRSLRDEADAAGDAAQVAICDAALDGDARSRALCGRVIRAARAQG